jgi:hypothetical protein
MQLGVHISLVGSVTIITSHTDMAVAALLPVGHNTRVLILVAADTLLVQLGQAFAEYDATYRIHVDATALFSKQGGRTEYQAQQQ